MPASADLSVRGAAKAAGGKRGFRRLFMPKTVHHDSRSIVPVSKKPCSAAANATAAPSTEIKKYITCQAWDSVLLRIIHASEQIDNN